MAAVSLQRSRSGLGTTLPRKERHNGMKVAIFATVRKLAKLVCCMPRWGQGFDADPSGRLHALQMQRFDEVSACHTITERGFRYNWLKDSSR